MHVSSRPAGNGREDPQNRHCSREPQLAADNGAAQFGQLTVFVDIGTISQVLFPIH